ncbi:hypothetical protein ACWU4D_07355 [Vibrio sp. WJH972]
MFNTRNSRPLQTLENVQQLIEANGIHFTYSRNMSAIMQFDGGAIENRDHQEQLLMDLATEQGFYRDGLKRVIRIAINKQISADYRALEKKKPTDKQQA